MLSLHYIHGSQDAILPPKASVILFLSLLSRNLIYSSYSRLKLTSQGTQLWSPINVITQLKDSSPAGKLKCYAFLQHKIKHIPCFCTEGVVCFLVQFVGIGVLPITHNRRPPYITFCTLDGNLPSPVYPYIVSINYE